MSAAAAVGALESRIIVPVGHSDLGGHGDTMHVNVVDGFAFVGHMGGDRIGTSVVDVSDPRHPVVAAQVETPPGIRSHKVQVVGDLMLVNHEQNPRETIHGQGGLMVYDVSRPWLPQRIGMLPIVGNGVHRMTYWQPPYAYLSASDDGYEGQILLIVDLTDPERPREVGRWWLEGMWTAGGETPSWPTGRTPMHHHSLVHEGRAYGGWWDCGMVILDITDVTAPQLIAQLEFGPQESRATHTALPIPGRDLVVVTDEALDDDTFAKQIRLVDTSVPGEPVVVGMMPPPPERYLHGPDRCGPHNLHEMRPGSLQARETVFATYFAAGVRVYDIADPSEPYEIAAYVPDVAGSGRIQLNDLTVTPDGMIYVTDRSGSGLHILQLECPAP